MPPCKKREFAYLGFDREFEIKKSSLYGNVHKLIAVTFHWKKISLHGNERTGFKKLGRHKLRCAVSGKRKAGSGCISRDLV